jgi:hypothetical protein
LPHDVKQDAQGKAALQQREAVAWRR